jgi:hypothetical protein
MRDIKEMKSLLFGDAALGGSWRSSIRENPAVVRVDPCRAVALRR